MEDINNQGSIDSKYTIINKKGHGQFGNVFLVEDTTNKSLYAAKVSKKKSRTFQNEKNNYNNNKELEKEDEEEEYKPEADRQSEQTQTTLDKNYILSKIIKQPIYNKNDYLRRRSN